MAGFASGSVRVGERPLASSLVTDVARGKRRSRRLEVSRGRCVAGRTSGAPQVVTASAKNRHMARHVRDAVIDRGDRPRCRRAHHLGSWRPGKVDCRLRADMSGIAVAGGARGPLRVLRVIEAACQAWSDGRMATLTDLVGDARRRREWEIGLAREVIDDLPERDELVRHAGGVAPADVTIDAPDALVRALGPRGHVRPHFVARAAELRTVREERRADEGRNSEHPDQYATCHDQGEMPSRARARCVRAPRRAACGSSF